MNPFIINATKSTPYILFDPDKQLFEVKGESYPENISEFYDPIIGNLIEYLKKLPLKQQFTINFEMIYFNSSSSKMLMNLFDVIDKISGTGKSIIINWIYDEDNDIALEYGEEFLEDLEHVSFNLIKVQNHIANPVKRELL